jgi:hypothetical protein
MLVGSCWATGSRRSRCARLAREATPLERFVGMKQVSNAGLTVSAASHEGWDWRRRSQDWE